VSHVDRRRGAGGFKGLFDKISGLLTTDKSRKKAKKKEKKKRRKKALSKRPQCRKGAAKTRHVLMQTVYLLYRGHGKRIRILLLLKRKKKKKFARSHKLS
jgi:hypothetical protein